MNYPGEKPIHVKPSLYAYIFIQLKEIALKYGYNLVLHGSMNRDLDLIAIPWVDHPGNDFEMIQEFELHLTGYCCKQLDHYMFSIHPGNRKTYVINLNRGGKWNNYQNIINRYICNTCYKGLESI